VARAVGRDYRLTHSELLRRVNWRGITAAQLRQLTQQLIQLGAITSSREKPPWKRTRQVYTWVWGLDPAAEPTDEDILLGFRRFCDFLRQQQPDAIATHMAA
jgi:hypothetical protein